MEEEKESKLSFLDVLICRQPDGKLSTSVYRKPTNTLQMLSYNSNHPLQHKRSCVRTLYRRVETHCSTPVAKLDEMKLLQELFRANGYPRTFVERSRKQPRMRNEEPIQPKSRRSIPYMKGVSEAVAGSLVPLGIGVAHRPDSTIRRQVMRPKDPILKQEMSVVVYRLQCSCGMCNYVGETGRRLQTRMHEHKLALRRLDPKSEVATHAAQMGHVFNFDAVEIVGRDAIDTTLNTELFLASDSQSSGQRQDSIEGLSAPVKSSRTLNKKGAEQGIRKNTQSTVAADKDHSSAKMKHAPHSSKSASPKSVTHPEPEKMKGDVGLSEESSKEKLNVAQLDLLIRACVLLIDVCRGSPQSRNNKTKPTQPVCWRKYLLFAGVCVKQLWEVVLTEMPNALKDAAKIKALEKKLKKSDAKDEQQLVERPQLKFSGPKMPKNCAEWARLDLPDECLEAFNTLATTSAQTELKSSGCIMNQLNHKTLRFPVLTVDSLTRLVDWLVDGNLPQLAFPCLALQRVLTRQPMNPLNDTLNFDSSCSATNLLVQLKTVELCVQLNLVEATNLYTSSLSSLSPTSEDFLKVFHHEEGSMKRETSDGAENARLEAEDTGRLQRMVHNWAETALRLARLAQSDQALSFIEAAEMACHKLSNERGTARIRSLLALTKAKLMVLENNYPCAVTLSTAALELAKDFPDIWLAAFSTKIEGLVNDPVLIRWDVDLHDHRQTSCAHLGLLAALRECSNAIGALSGRTNTGSSKDSLYEGMLAEVRAIEFQLQLRKAKCSYFRLLLSAVNQVDMDKCAFLQHLLESSEWSKSNCSLMASCESLYNDLNQIGDKALLLRGILIPCLEYWKFSLRVLSIAQIDVFDKSLQYPSDAFRQHALWAVSCAENTNNLCAEILEETQACICEIEDIGPSLPIQREGALIKLHYADILLNLLSVQCKYESHMISQERKRSDMCQVVRKFTGEATKGIIYAIPPTTNEDRSFFGNEYFNVISTAFDRTQGLLCDANSSAVTLPYLKAHVLHGMGRLCLLKRELNTVFLPEEWDESAEEDLANHDSKMTTNRAESGRMSPESTGIYNVVVNSVEEIQAPGMINLFENALQSGVRASELFLASLQLSVQTNCMVVAVQAAEGLLLSLGGKFKKMEGTAAGLLNVYQACSASCRLRACLAYSLLASGSRTTDDAVRCGDFLKHYRRPRHQSELGRSLQRLAWLSQGSTNVMAYLGFYNIAMPSGLLELTNSALGILSSGLLMGIRGRGGLSALNSSCGSEDHVYTASPWWKKAMGDLSKSRKVWKQTAVNLAACLEPTNASGPVSSAVNSSSTSGAIIQDSGHTFLLRIRASSYSVMRNAFQLASRDFMKSSTDNCPRETIIEEILRHVPCDLFSAKQIRDKSKKTTTGTRVLPNKNGLVLLTGGWLFDLPIENVFRSPDAVHRSSLSLNSSKPPSLTGTGITTDTLAWVARDFSIQTLLNRFLTEPKTERISKSATKGGVTATERSLSLCARVRNTFKSQASPAKGIAAQKQSIGACFRVASTDIIFLSNDGTNNPPRDQMCSQILRSRPSTGGNGQQDQQKPQITTKRSVKEQSEGTDLTAAAAGDKKNSSNEPHSRSYQFLSEIASNSTPVGRVAYQINDAARTSRCDARTEVAYNIRLFGIPNVTII
nr:unnamed protein product [Spirometra erinaceieuropaei]